MFASNSMVLMIIALLGLGAASIGGWSMYFLEKEDHASTRIAMSQTKADSGVEQTVETNADQDGISELGQMKSEREFLGRELEFAISEQARLAQELESMIRVRDRVSADLADAKSERKRVESELNKKITAVEAKLETQSGTETEEQVLLESELDRLRETRDRLSADLEQARRENDIIKTDLDRRIEIKEVELSDTAGRVTSLDTRIQQASDTIVGLETQVKMLSREKDEISSQFSGIRRELESELQTRIIEIEQLREELTVLVIASDILFDAGSANLSASGTEALQGVASALNEFPERPVSLEGHTDSVPIASHRTGTYASNWELSTARAATAVRFLQSQGVDPARLRAVGYGEHQPVASNEEVGLRSLNRRLEIKLLPREQSVPVQSLD